jgi:hypothetical protein
MWCSLERELQIPPEEEILAPKEEPQEVVEQPQIEEQRVETSTQAEPSREGRKRTREADRDCAGCEGECGSSFKFAQAKKVT